MASSGPPDLPDYSDQGSRLELMVVVAIIFLVLSYISVALRIYVRVFMLRAFQLDDISILICLALFTGYCVIFVGLRQSQISTQATAALEEGLSAQLAVLAEVMKWVLASYGIYLSLSVLLKISVALSFLRILNSRWQRYTIYITTAIYTTYGISFWGVAIFQCGDPTKFLIHQAEGTCLSQDVVIPLNYVFSGLNIISDWIFVVIPVIMVWRSKMPRITKYTAAFLLNLAAISSISSIVRLKFIPGLKPGREFLHASVSVAIWSAVETGLMIVTISLSTLRPLFKSALGGSSNQSRPYIYEDRIGKRRMMDKSGLTMVRTNPQDRHVEALYRISDDGFCTPRGTTTFIGVHRSKAIEMKDLPDGRYHFEESNLEKGTNSLHRSESEQSLVIQSNMEHSFNGIMATTRVIVKHDGHSPTDDRLHGMMNF